MVCRADNNNFWSYGKVTVVQDAVWSKHTHHIPRGALMLYSRLMVYWQNLQSRIIVRTLKCMSWLLQSWDLVVLTFSRCKFGISYYMRCCWRPGNSPLHEANVTRQKPTPFGVCLGMAADILRSPVSRRRWVCVRG